MDMFPRRKEQLVEHRITYVLELDGMSCVIENVPARVVQETGEQLLAPHTVERLQEVIERGLQLRQFARTLVYEYSE
jgi:hypothetical protein